MSARVSGRMSVTSDGGAHFPRRHEPAPVPTRQLNHRTISACVVSGTRVKEDDGTDGTAEKALHRVGDRGTTIDLAAMAERVRQFITDAKAPSTTALTVRTGVNSQHGAATSTSKPSRPRRKPSPST